MYRNKPQVVELLSPQMELPDVVDLRGNLERRAAPQIPFICYPSGVPCFYANIFMLSLYDDDYSITDEGGSLSTYAFLISPILRFCHDSRIQLDALSDLRFKNFKNWLHAKKTFRNKKKPGARQINKILRFTLRFLHFVGVEMGNPDFVSPNGIIRGELVLVPSKRRANGQPTFMKVWHHACLLTEAGSSDKVVPMSSDALAALRDQVDKISSRYIRRRTDVMLHIYESMGARRAEGGTITVSNIKKALESTSHKPPLIVNSRKGRRGAVREINVPRYILEDTMEFINTERRILLAKFKMKTEDVDPLFISERTGKPLSVRYVTTQFHNLRKAAGIEEKAHAHQLRHLFISKGYEKQLMKILSTEKSPWASFAEMKLVVVHQMMQDTGHSKPSSFMTYTGSVNAKIEAILLSGRKPSVGPAMDPEEFCCDLLDDVMKTAPKEVYDRLNTAIQGVMQDYRAAKKAEFDS